MKVTYLTSVEYLQICDKHPKTKGRASLVHSLIASYGMFDGKINIVEPTPASVSDLLNFHSKDYIDCLRNIDKKFQSENITDEDNMIEFIDLDELDDEFDINSYGLGYDCELFPNMFDYVRYVVGGSLTAVHKLIDGTADVAINLNGGWHHAHVDEAAGFCYANDIVISILSLLKKYKRILYIDLDIHHGDGVEEAFEHSSKVYTFSMHKCSAGFFPGTGDLSDSGIGAGQNYSLNVPLKDGTNDDTFYTVFSSLFKVINTVFKPEVIIVQCGADALSHDPMGTFNLTSEAYCKCVKDVLSIKQPVLILGGGGYNLSNTARCWTEVIGSVIDKELDVDIPTHDNIENYGPDYLLSIAKSNRRDENTKEELQSLVQSCVDKIMKLKNDDLIPKEIDVEDKTNKENEDKIILKRQRTSVSTVDEETKKLKKLVEFNNDDKSRSMHDV